ncbi:TlpA family protein disulfide reductase [Dactylosporangium sp. CA-233914]|uniref:TlpA family protein disulfide reductase n=1 Tax=Dactylosporangium sp. CA-233914 TaxID=3239934 RepID=UPI003D8B93CC
MGTTQALAGYAAVTATVALGLVLLLIRRLRHGAPARHPLPDSGPEIGRPAPALDLPPGVEAAAGPRLLAFYSVDCAGCRHSLPRFLPYAREFAGTGGQVVAVIVGDERGGAELASFLHGIATVVHEPEPGVRAQRYGIRLFPQYVLVDADGQVIATTHSATELPHLAGRA